MSEIKPDLSQLTNEELKAAFDKGRITLDDVLETATIIEAFRRSGGRRQEAANILRVSLATLYTRCRNLFIPVPGRNKPTSSKTDKELARPMGYTAEQVKELWNK